MPRAPQINVQPAARGSERTAVVTFSQLGEDEVQAHVNARVGANGPELDIAFDPGVRVKSRCVERPVGDALTEQIGVLMATLEAALAGDGYARALAKRACAASVEGGGLESPPRFANVRTDGGHFYGVERHTVADKGVNFSARWDLFLIREAWDQGLDLEGLADGYGPGAGTHGDWSGIRDSSPEAITAMTEAALNFLFPRSR